MRRKAEGSTPSPPTGGSLITVRSSIGSGHQPLKLERRVRLPHGPLFDSPGGGTGRRAGLRSTCPRGVGVRISPRRLNPLQAGRCPAGPHKPGVPGSIPGPGTRGWAGARPSVIRSEAEVRLPDPQLSVFMARYANRQSDPAQTRGFCGFDSHPRYSRLAFSGGAPHGGL